LGSADVDLMKRLVSILGKTKHKFIVSKGPQASEYDLASNMVGAEFLPQISIIPKVDLVITHGGNNTTTESVHFGKPMIVLPLFGINTTMPNEFTKKDMASDWQLMHLKMKSSQEQLTNCLMIQHCFQN
jgi:UDP-N-acetylglucosamine:LPS N-acetylglucosamine transferase